MRTLEGDEESLVVKHLLKLRDALQDQKQGQGLPKTVSIARDEVINLVNNFFYDKLTTIPEFRTIWKRSGADLRSACFFGKNRYNDLQYRNALTGTSRR